MAVPTLTPASTLSAIVLPSAGNLVDVAATLPFGIYASSQAFLTGAVDQVGYVYKKLGGDVLDIELTTGNVYAVSQSKEKFLPSLISDISNTFAIKSDGSLWSWGLNSNGELGQSDLKTRVYPNPIL